MESIEGTSKTTSGRAWASLSGAMERPMLAVGNRAFAGEMASGPTETVTATMESGSRERATGMAAISQKVFLHQLRQVVLWRLL